MNAPDPSDSLKIARAHHNAGRLVDAEAAYRQILAETPENPDALDGMGILAVQTGRGRDGLEMIRRAISLAPMVARYYLNLGAALDNLKEIDEAIAAYRRAVEIKPDYAAAWSNLGDALRRKGFPGEAADSCREALRLQPNLREARRNLGVALLALNSYEESAAEFRKSIALRPDWPEAHQFLGEALLSLGRFDESIAALLRANHLALGSVAALNSLGSAFQKIGRLDSAIDCFDRASVGGGANSRLAASNRLYILQYHPAYDPLAILKEHQLWNQRFAQPLSERIAPHPNSREPDRRLKIGYVSTDFYGHCQTLFTTPLLSSHDHAQFEIYLYADILHPDANTDRLRTFADVWRPTTGIDDQALAGQIRADQIDVLIDLNMHMGNGRPLLFARKPAPVQAAWLAYPGTTGLSAMDARLTDPYLDPPGHGDDRYTEQSIRLPDTFWCYDPAALQTGPAPIAGPLPADHNGHVTFGCFNNFCKINDGVLGLWSRVLHATPRSRLRMLAPPGEARRWTLDRFAGHGVDMGRIEFVGHQPRGKYLSEYGRVDLGLDTLPYNGHTTSLDSFWMGVPVVTRIGATVVGRAGFSQLSNLNLTELAAGEDEMFVRITGELARDLPRLRELRRTLRDRMRASPLMDAKRFARGFESALRSLWKQFSN